MVIEADERTAYAYLYKKKEIVADVWIFNRVPTSDEAEWEFPGVDPPFANPNRLSKPCSCADEITEDDFRVLWRPEASPRSAGVYLRERLVAVLIEGQIPSKSAYAIAPSPLAIPLGDSEIQK